MPYSDIKKIPPNSIAEFRGYTAPADTIEIPEVAKNRKSTDYGFLLGFSIFSLLAEICIVAVIFQGINYDRFLNGYDKCGDTCGTINEPIKGIECSGKDLRDKPIMEIKYYQKKNQKKKKVVALPKDCIKKCTPPNELQFGRCFPKSNATLDDKSRNFKMFTGFADEVKSSIPCLCAMCSTGLGNNCVYYNRDDLSPELVLTLVIFLCLRFNALATIWAILILQLIGLTAFTIFIWIAFSMDPSASENLYIGILLTMLLLLMFIFICYFHGRYDLVAFMFNQSVRVIFRSPLLLIIPLLTSIFLGLMIAGTVFLIALLSTNQNLINSPIDPSIYDYQISSLAQAAIGLWILTDLWMIAIAHGCQCLIISGAVAADYFATDKSKLRFTALTSMYILLRFHGGTACFGALTISFLVIGRCMQNALKSRVLCKKIVTLVKCEAWFIHKWTNYLAKRGYIQTAMHGKPFYESGVRAARLFWSNLLDTIDLDLVMDLVVFASLVLVLLIAVAVGTLINPKYITHEKSVLLVATGATGILVFFYLQVLNVAVETIYLCFCEDKLLHLEDSSYVVDPNLEKILETAKQRARQQDE